MRRFSVITTNCLDKLLLTLTTPGWGEYKCDFNRFKYWTVTSSKKLNHKDDNLRKGGDKFAQKLYEMFCEQTSWSDSTKVMFYVTFVEYVIHCDKNNLEPCSKDGLLGWYDHNVNMHMLSNWVDSTCKTKMYAVRSVISNLDFPADEWLANCGVFGNTQQNHRESYSDTDIAKLLRIVMKMFNQLYSQFIERPQYYIEHAKQNKFKEKSNAGSMLFNWNNRLIRVHAPITKLASLSCYLLAYYSWGNTTQLFNIIRPQIDGQTLEEKWAKMPAFKRRANKYISIELGENDSLEIPRHAVKVFEKIQNISTTLNPNPGAHLLLCVKSGRTQPINSYALSQFNRWLKNNIDLRDDFDRPLVPEAGRFRASGINRFQVYTGDLLRPTIISGNTPQVLNRNYSTGNKHDNDMQIQANALTLENSSRNRKGIEDAKQATKEQMNVKVLPYEAFLKQLSPPLRIVNGSYCAQPFGDQASKQNKKAVQRKILKLGERLACTDLLKCFECPDQVIVETIEELWCILSFKECLEESAYLHLDRKHFKNNFEYILLNIDYRLTQVNQKLLRKAEQKIIDDGRHPLWQDNENISIKYISK